MGKLTVKAIEAARPKDKPYKLMDGNGLVLRIAIDGSKYWLIRYFVNKKERQYSFPERYREKSGEGFCSLQDAREKASIIRALARQGTDYRDQLEEEIQLAALRRSEVQKQQTIQENAEIAASLSVKDMFEEWLKNGVRRDDGNTELKRSFAADILPNVGGIPVREITEDALRNVLRTLVNRGVNRSAVIARNNLTQMFAWAAKRQPWRKLLVDGNPMDLIEIEKIVEKNYDLNNVRDRFLSDREIYELKNIFATMELEYAAAEDKRSTSKVLLPSVRCAVWIMLSTLCRVGELTMARWEDVDLDGAKWFIPKSNVKGKVADLLVFLSPFAVANFRLLREDNGDSEWCFPARNKPGHVYVKSMSKQIGDRQSRFKKARDGGPRQPMKNRKHDNSLVLADGENGKWIPHDLRRTGATLMQSLGISMEIIDRCQNHVLGGSKVRRSYLLHDYADEKRLAWDRLGNRIESILNPQKVPSLTPEGSDRTIQPLHVAASTN